MDVTVTLLNHRLALKLPPELPLGLVFVVGRVANLVQGTQNGRLHALSCDLQDADHQIRCVLLEQAAREITLHDGDKVRVGGHLVFDPQWASYYLLAREVGVMETADPATTVSPPAAVEREGLRVLLQDIQKRAAAARLPPAELPAWFKKLSHLEEEAAQGGGSEETAVSQIHETSPADALPSPDMIRQLSEAMDSTEEIELTAEMAAQLPHPPSPSEKVIHAYEIPPEKAATPVPEETTSQLHSSYHPPTRRQVERSHAWWVVILLLITILVILAILSTAGLL